MVTASVFESSINYADVAGLTYLGLYYRCFVWSNYTVGSLKISSAIFVEQEQGEDVMVLLSSITEGDVMVAPPTCPKVIAYGNKFIAFWIDEDGVTLNKAYMDLSNLHNVSTWTVVASPITIHSDGLYDVHTVGDFGGNGDTTGDNYVVAYKEPTNGYLRVRHYNDLTWTHDWANEKTDVVINVIGAYANASEGDVVVCYEIDITNQLWAVRYDEVDGSNMLSALVFDALGGPATAANWGAVAMCRAGANRVAVVGECLPTSVPDGPAAWLGEKVRLVAYRAIVGSTAAQTQDEFWTWNVSLQSRPWAYSSDDTDGLVGPDGGTRVYAMLGHIGANEPYRWASTSFFVADLHHEDWGTATEGNNLATPSSNMNLGTSDARAHNVESVNSGTLAKGYNHVSSAAVAPQYGPNIKSRTIAQVIFRRLTTEGAVDTEGEADLDVTVPVPTSPTVRGYRFLPEDPWMPHRHSSDPNDPTSNFDGVYTRGHTQAVDIGNGLFISGGCPSFYDGSQVAEVGYSWAPEMGGFAYVSSGNVEDGVHRWTAVYEWRDAKGQLHRSMPARPYYIDLLDPSLTGASRLSMRVLCQNLTLKHGNFYTQAPAISIAVYRTQKDGSIYYRIGQIISTATNDVTKPDVSISDNFADDSIKYNEILPYQFVNGAWSPMVNFQPPAFATITRWNNRVWGVSSEDERDIWYSMEMFAEPGGVTYEAPRFNPINRHRIDDCSGVTAMREMDGALIVFARDRIFALRGLGNTDIGTGTTLDHQIVADGIGCVNPKSVVLGPTGIFFQSDKGYQQLSRTMEIDYLAGGASVEDKIRLAGNVRSAVLLEDRHEIRLSVDEAVTSTPTTLVYNYLFGQWTRHTLPQMYTQAKFSGTVDAVYWRGESGEEAHVILQTSNIGIERETDGTEFKDEGSGGEVAIAISLETDWIHLAGLLGFYRLRQVLVQCQKPDASEVTVGIDYDYTGKYLVNGDASDQFTFTSPAGTVLGCKTSVQKVNAFRVQVTETGSVPKTENIQIMGLSLEYAQKPGAIRLPDASFVEPT